MQQAQFDMNTKGEPSVGTSYQAAIGKQIQEGNKGFGSFQKVHGVAYVEIGDKGLKQDYSTVNAEMYQRPRTEHPSLAEGAKMKDKMLKPSFQLAERHLQPANYYATPQAKPTETKSYQNLVEFRNE